MSDASFWDQWELSFKQLPTLQELFCSCDGALLAKTIMREYAVRAVNEVALPHKRRRAMEKRVAATLDAMCNLPVKRKRNHTKILLPEESFALDMRSGFIERKLSASLATLEDVPTARYMIEAWDDCADSSDGYKQALPFDDLTEQQLRCYIFDAWEDTLVDRVWLGGPWCCRERYLVLASAFWEMTYCGFEHDQAHANQMCAKVQRGFEVDPKRPKGDKGDCGGGAQPLATISELSHQRSGMFGLTVPDAFEDGFRDRMAVRVSELNNAARFDFWHRLLDVAFRLGVP